jgi:prepilin-type N-terminal cleavage/methylation domain-containing protein
MQKFKHGFVLIELVIVLAIIGILAIFVLPGARGWFFSAQVQAKAEKEMRMHIHTLYPGWSEVRVACSNVDSDDDGYVRCTATAQHNGKTETVEAECAAPIFMTWRKGCVPIKVVRQ